MEDEDQEETHEKLNENHVHICRIQLETKDDLFDHVQADHKEYFDGMMEVRPSESSQIRISCSLPVGQQLVGPSVLNGKSKWVGLQMILAFESVKQLKLGLRI
jgi:hypothetical protein